jgi:hypothetical protein
MSRATAAMGSGAHQALLRCCPRPCGHAVPTREKVCLLDHILVLESMKDTYKKCDSHKPFSQAMKLGLREFAIVGSALTSFLSFCLSI